MSANQEDQGKLPSLNDIISPEKEVEPNNVIINEEKSPIQIEITGNVPGQQGNITQSTVNQTSTRVNEGPTVVKITRKVVTNSQPITESHVTKTKITTITQRGGEPVTNVKTTKYNNPASASAPRINTNKTTTTTTTNYTRPNVTQTGTYNRPGSTINSNINNKNTNSNINKNQAYRNYNPPSRMQNSQSYAGNRNQPQRPQVSSSNYKPKAVSPGPGTIKRKTINRGKPVENIQITHIIYSPRNLEFHITEDLNLDNLNKPPIQITEEERNNLQKSGKVEVTCSCDSDKIKKQEPPNLEGTLTHYQHAQGIGMTDDKNPNINPKFYFSEIKTLEPLVFNNSEPNTEVLQFRSGGKDLTTTRTVIKTQTKPTTTNYNTARTPNNYTKNRAYNTPTQQKINTGVYNRGMGSTIKTTTSTSSYRGTSGDGNSGQILKETTTKVQMGSRSQYQNQSKPITTTSTERKVYNQNNFFKK